MYGGIQNPSECLFLINLTTPFHYLGCRRISIAQCNEYHLETFWQYYVSPEPLIYSIPSSPPEIFSGVEFILYVCPTVQPSQVSQSPDESGLGNQLSSQPMRSQENWSPLAKESFCKSTDNQHWECRLTETNISLCPLAQHWNLWTGTLPFVKWTLQNLKLLFWLIVTKVKKLNMGWKEPLK